jgi:hypothetical protein
MRVIFLALIGLVVFGTMADARGRGGGSHFRSGYIKPSTGQYVAPSRATNPNRTQFDNYSTKGNVNPYSGRMGTRNPLY